MTSSLNDALIKIALRHSNRMLAICCYVENDLTRKRAIYHQIKMNEAVLKRIERKT